MKYSIILSKLLFLLIIACSPGCRKNSVLSEQPNTVFYVPASLTDMQGLLDNVELFRQSPGLGMLSADEYIPTEAFWNESLLPYEHNACVWNKTIFSGEEMPEDWTLPYQQILYSNVVLEKLPGIALTSSNETFYKKIKGSAFFLRAYANYELAQVFAAVYDEATASLTPGIALRFSADIEENPARSTLRQTYDQIIADLSDAVRLLPPRPEKLYRNRPNGAAAWGMLARVYIAMGDYPHAKTAADNCLNLYNTLLDFNAGTAQIAISTNDETLYQGRLMDHSGITSGMLEGTCFVDTGLYNSYLPDDLRKSIYFRLFFGVPVLQHSYSGTIFPFTGIATDEIMLIRAECNAKAGNVPAALNDLNTLLEKRWQTGKFTPLQAENPNKAIDIIRKERSKELVMRGQRWSDLRRYNKEGVNITLKRILNQQLYQLPSGDLKWVLPIPEKAVIQAGMQQNPR